MASSPAITMFRMRSPEIYPYAPLDLSRQTFRLIRLLPPKPPVIPGCYGTLRIEIIEAEIDATSKPSRAYDALTYVWGVAAHEKPNRAIIVEDRGASYRLWIHRPLELALLHLVQDRATQLPLFVDQICINQDANGGGYNEKAHQVRLMRAIYSRCRRALVWLGTATRASDEWFTYTREICHSGLLSGLMGPRAPSFMRVFDAVMDPSVSVAGQTREDRDALLALVLLRGDQYPVAGFADVLDRPWFGRLWTIQEACLAPGVTVVCGRQALCLECFRAGALFFSVCNTHWVRQPGPRTRSELRRRDAIFQKTPRLHRVVQERKAIHATGVRQSFYDVVLKYNVNGGRAKIGATLPEDRIFGLLGLAADDDPLRRRVRVRYDAVDPEAGVVRIYTEVAALLLGHSVDALLYVQAGRKTGGLPSWVPDWTMELRLPVGYASLKEALFCAGGPEDQGRFCVDLEAGRLTIRGCMVGEVVAVGERAYRDRVDGMMQRDVDYRWAKKFFDEAAQFTRDAGAMRDDDEASLALRSRRVCDSGLSHEQFVRRLGVDDGVRRLGVVHGYYYRIGRRLLESDETVASYHISRIYRTVGITPWYFMPPPEMDTLRMCARDPSLACRVLCSAVGDFVEDMVGMCVASARISVVPYYLRLRRRYAKVTLHVGDEAMRKHGFDPDQGTREDMAAFSDNILKNVGRRLYRTATGYVGIGPPEMRPGDAVTVFHGGTTPHLLRRVARPESGNDELWQYVGEAYCDGMMHGEALEATSERSFTLC